MIAPGLSKHLLHHYIQSLGGADCHLALLRDNADYGTDTRVFDGAGEIRAQGYAQGGKRLTNFSCGLDNGIAWANWSSPEWLNASIRASGAVIYAKNWGNLVVAVFAFEEEQASSNSLFRCKMPPPGADNAIIWLA